MEAYLISKKAPATEDTDSPSSLVAEPPISDSPDQLLANENVDADKKAEEDRKQRRLERRKALAMERCPLPPVLKSANNTIDLTNEDDDPSNKWFKKTFNTEKLGKKVKSPKDEKVFAVPRHIAKNAPRSLINKEALQKNLQASLAVKRRKAQEERRKMYEEDNEHLKPDEESEEEEEEEEVVFKKKKTKKPEESDSEDDEDYKPPGEDEKRDDDEMSVNLLNDSFTYDVFNHVKGPGSTVSTFDSRSQDDPTDKLPTMSQLMGRPVSSSANFTDDLLDMCTGDFPDTLQMLMEGKKSAERAPAAALESTSPANPESAPEDNDDNDEEEEEEDVGPVKKKILTKKRNRILDSDDEEDDVEEEDQKPSQDVFGEESDDVKESEDVTEQVEALQLTRVVVSGDEDSEGDEEEEDVDDEEEGEEEEDDPEDVEEPEDVAEPNFDDEDDELAVYKRIEHQEYKKQIKKRTLFDDEASLSGDDVGSDVEDEEGVENAYEAEEGDADDVPDNDTIRRQNFKMLLKQENDKETRALAKLQDRLLADGDLGGVETNRQFRFKLREEVEIRIGGDADGQEQDEDDEPEEDEEKKKERAEMIKYRIEHAEELELLEATNRDEDDEMFTRAGKILKTTEKTVVEVSTKTVVSVQKPSLLSKTTLAVSFQEVLNGSGNAPKQMYVQNFDKMNSGASTTSSRLSSGLKRGAVTSPEAAGQAKRVRSSKLSSLE